MSVPNNMCDALLKHARMLRYNNSQKVDAALVCSVLREPVMYWIPMAEEVIRLGTNLRSWIWRHRLWKNPAPTNLDPAYLRMQTCIANCVAKVDRAWHWNPAIQEPPGLDFDDLFRLILGTVDIPLSPETTALIGNDDRVLIGRHFSKTSLYGDTEWCEILQQMASVVERDEQTLARCEQICASVEGYTTNKLHEEREALKAAETHEQVESAVTLGIHREPQHPSTDTTTLKSLMHRLLEF